jgi:glycine cleavage system regulatory protein
MTTRWFILSAIGRDRPGLVSELAQLVLDCDANLEDSRMTILGTDFAVILLCSSRASDAADRLALGSKRLERDHGLTILIASRPRARTAPASWPASAACSRGTVSTSSSSTARLGPARAARRTIR